MRRTSKETPTDNYEPMKRTKEALDLEIEKGKRIIENLRQNYDTVLKQNRRLQERNGFLLGEVGRLNQPFWKKINRLWN